VTAPGGGPRLGRLSPAPAAALAAALVLAGCGSSARAPRTTATGSAAARATAGWRVVSTRTAPGRKVGVIGGTMRDPEALELRVASSPRVVSQVDYSIDCELSGTHPVAVTIPENRTPLTVPIPVPANARSCFLAATASKSASALMTLTLLVRRGRATTG
jgi:hypothetical protein